MKQNSNNSSHTQEIKESFFDQPIIRKPVIGNEFIVFLALLMVT